MFSLEDKRLRGDFITMFQYIQGGYKEDRDSPFTRNHMENKRVNGYKSFLRRFQLDTKGTFFVMRAINHWNNSPRKAVDFPTLDTAKIKLDRVLGCLV